MKNLKVKNYPNNYAACLSGKLFFNKSIIALVELVEFQRKLMTTTKKKFYPKNSTWIYTLVRHSRIYQITIPTGQIMHKCGFIDKYSEAASNS